MEQKKKPTGTREWADRNVNIQVACENNCSYCYAAAGAQGQYGYVEKGKWGEPVLRWKAINSPWKIRTRKNVMFPSTHDITEFNVEHYLTVAKKLLRVDGVRLLIVSKPRLEIIKRLCKELIQWQDRIMFRFTIGSVSGKTLKYWEPDAPNYEERIRSLKHAYKTGYRTSVSIEPLLDMTPYALVDAIALYVTEAIWIGKMKHGKARTKINGHGEK
jgi:DNA repair photolyase